MKMLNILGKIVFTLILPLCMYGKSEVKLQLSKQTVYIGEPLLATIVHSYKEEDKVLKKEFEQFISKDFWLQKSHEVKVEKENNTTYERYEFVIAPQKYGTLSVEKQLLRVSHRDPKTNHVKWEEFYTEELFVEVLPLPLGTTVVGNFSIDSSVDKSSIEQNKPINLTLTLKGYGNFEDIEPFTLDLPNQTQYSTKPVIQTNYKENQNYGKFIQKISIIGDDDYTIPAISLSYFNTKTKALIVIKTKLIPIKVTNKTPKKFEEFGYILLFLGIILGIVLSWLFVIYKKFQKQKTKNLTLKQKIQNAKNDKELYRVLLPYSNEEQFEVYLKKLEENIFSNGTHKIDRRKLLKGLS